MFQNRELVLNRVNLLSPPDFPRIWNLDVVKVGMAAVQIPYAFLGTGKGGDKGAGGTTVKINSQSRSKSTDFANCPQASHPAVPVVLNHENEVYIGIISQNLLIGRLNDHPDLPIMADDNPLFDDGLPLGLSYGPNANSRSHRGAGQNVLTLSGRVRWKTDPNCGVDGDNIWTLFNVKIYTGREGPKSSSDSHLLK